MVIEVLISSNFIPSKSSSISSKEQMETPTLPTSPVAKGWSQSYPICVGKSKATLKPVTPCDKR